MRDTKETGVFLCVENGTNKWEILDCNVRTGNECPDEVMASCCRLVSTITPNIYQNTWGCTSNSIVVQQTEDNELQV
jgi:hypothetical protein